MSSYNFSTIKKYIYIKMDCIVVKLEHTILHAIIISSCKLTIKNNKYYCFHSIRHYSIIRSRFSPISSQPLKKSRIIPEIFIILGVRGKSINFYSKQFSIDWAWIEKQHVHKTPHKTERFIARNKITRVQFIEKIGTREGGRGGGRYDRSIGR